MDSTPNTGSQAIPSAIAAAGPAARAAWDHLTGGAGYRASTRQMYHSTARRFLDWMNSRVVGLAQITPAQVEEFLNGLEVTRQSRSQYRTALRCLFDALVVRGVIPTNPADTARLDAPTPMPEAGSAKEDPPTLEELNSYVRELALEPIEEGSDDFDAALVMLAALSLGTGKIMPLSRLTGVAPRRVSAFAHELRANGVWTADGKTAGQWFDEDGGHLAFWMDVWVAQGLMERVPAEDAALSRPEAQAEPPRT